MDLLLLQWGMTHRICPESEDGGIQDGVAQGKSMDVYITLLIFFSPFSFPADLSVFLINHID